MLDMAIIGGGLCGLVLARSSYLRGQGVALFEARDRLGGRILSVPRGYGGGLDLGPTWFWPKTQPLIAQLVNELASPEFASMTKVASAFARARKSAERVEGKRALRRRAAFARTAWRSHRCVGNAVAGWSHASRSRACEPGDCGDHVTLTLAAGEDADRGHGAARGARHSAALAGSGRSLRARPWRGDPRSHARHGNLDGGAGQGCSLTTRLLARGRTIRQRFRRSRTSRDRRNLRCLRRQPRQRRPGRPSRIVAGVARGFQRWPAIADGQPTGTCVRRRAGAGRAALSGLGDRALHLQRA